MYKKISRIILIGLLTVLIFSPIISAYGPVWIPELFSSVPAPVTTGPVIDCYFSPNGGCTKAIINEIKAATSTIYVQAFQFSSVWITDALVEAHKNKIKVEIVLDKYQKTAKGSTLDAAVSAGIPCYIDSKHTSAHNKIMLIDGRVLITGSFNFTYNAECKNAENIVIIRNAPELIKRYQVNYIIHKGHSNIYKEE